MLKNHTILTSHKDYYIRSTYYKYMLHNPRKNLEIPFNWFLFALRLVGITMVGLSFVGMAFLSFN